MRYWNSIQCWKEMISMLLCDNRVMWDFLKSSIHQALKMLITDEINIVDLE
jgi:hypothetical protein